MRRIMPQRSAQEGDTASERFVKIGCAFRPPEKRDHLLIVLCAPESTKALTGTPFTSTLT